jgi:Fe-S cluster assembly ATP-binding protein
LNPKLILLDEIDSGLDIDAIKIICETIANEKKPNTGLIIITHYPKILKLIFNQHHIHIMMEGKIIRTGNLELIDILEKEGYDYFLKK